MFRNNKNLKLQCAVPHIFIEGSKMGHYCSTIDNNDLIYNSEYLTCIRLFN